MAIILITLKDNPPGLKKYTGYNKFDVVEARPDSAGLGRMERPPLFLIVHITGPADRLKYLMQEDKKGKIFLKRRKYALNVHAVGLEKINEAIKKRAVLQLDEKAFLKK